MGWYMDDDNKMRKKGEITVTSFLPEINQGQETAPKLYDLDEEFQKTKKNKDYLVVFGIIFFTSFIGLTAYFLTSYIKRTNEKLTIDIRDFEDVNLSDLLDTTRKFNQELELINENIRELKEKWEEEKEVIQENTSSKINILQATEKEQRQVQKMLSFYRNDEKKMLERVDELYRKKIRQQEEDRELVLEKLESYDSRQLEKAKKSEEVLSTQKKLYEMELGQLTQEYETKVKELKENNEKRISNIHRGYKYTIEKLRERHREETDQLILKYNPVITKEEFQELLNQSENFTENTSDQVKLSFVEEVPEQIQQWELESKEREREFRLLAGRLSEIPYVNSVPPLITAIRERAQEIRKSYEKIFGRVWDELTEKREKLLAAQTRLKDYETALQNLVMREEGVIFIADANDPEAVSLSFMGDFSPEEGEAGEIFRNGSERIGLLQFWKDEEEKLFGKLVEITEGEKVLPFDRVTPVLDERDSSTDLTNGEKLFHPEKNFDVQGAADVFREEVPKAESGQR